MKTMSVTIALLSFALAIMIAIWTLAEVQTRIRTIRNWGRLDNAVVLESKVELRGPWPVPVIVYEYHSEDVYYVGQDSPSRFFPFARSLAERYRPGDMVTIYANPDDHQVSMLFLSPPIWVCVVGLLCATVLASLGALALMQ